MFLIIFGAGASYDHSYKHRVGVGKYRLPLANDLINTSLTFVREACSKWPGAVPILNRLNSLKEKDKTFFDLESELHSLSQRNNPDIHNQLLSFKFYIYDIISNSEE